MTLPVVSLRRANQRELLPLEKGFRRPGQTSTDYQVELRPYLGQRASDVCGLPAHARKLPVDLVEPRFRLRMDVDSVLRQQKLKYPISLCHSLPDVLLEREGFQRASNDRALCPSEGQSERLQLDVVQRVGRLRYALTQHQNPKAFTSEK